MKSETNPTNTNPQVNNMEHDEIMEKVMDHYDHPRNFGVLDKYDVQFSGGNAGCGDVLTVYLKLSEDGSKIEDVSFSGEGCIISQASASLITDMIKGLKVEELSAFNSERMKEILGKDIVIRRPRCANLIVDTLKSAVQRYQSTPKTGHIHRNAV